MNQELTETESEMMRSVSIAINTPQFAGRVEHDRFEYEYDFMSVYVAVFSFATKP